MIVLDTFIPYLYKIQKIYKSCDTPYSSASISIFSSKISKCWYIKKYKYRLFFDTQFLILLTFLKSFRITLIKIVINLVKLAKVVTLGLLKIEIVWNKEYGVIISVTAQKMKFSMKDFFSKCHEIRRKLPIWSHLLKKSLMENFLFCAVFIT